MRFLRRTTAKLMRWPGQVFRFPRTVFRFFSRTSTRLLSAILRFPARLVTALVSPLRRSVRQWAKATRGRDLVIGLPSLVLCSGFILLAMMGLRGESERKINAYDAAARQAVARGDYEAAKIYLKRVIQIGGDRPDTRFMLGKLAIENGDSETAKLLMADLAPIDRPVQYEAHLWRAQQLLTRSSISADELREAEAQLINASKLRHDADAANSLLGQLYRQTRRNQKAREHFLRVSPRSPTDDLYLAEVHQALGETVLAQAAAQRARQSFANRCKRRPRDLESLLKLSASLRFMRQFAEADRVLRSTALLAGQPALLKERIVNIVAWYDTIERREDTLGQRLEFLRSALQINPQDPLIYDRLLHLLLAGGEGADVVRKSLQHQITEGTAPALVHLLLGIDAGMRKDDSVAIYHYRTAMETDPSLTVAGNNLALSLLALSPPRIEEAGLLATQLCDKFPEVAAFQETRGQVLLRAKKYAQSLEAFELAIGELAHEPSIHRGMAEAYEAIGLDELAASHRDWIARRAAGKR